MSGASTGLEPDRNRRILMSKAPDGRKGVPTNGKRIVERRKLLGYTQATLAKMAGWDVRSVRRAEKGERVALESLTAIAQVLDVHPSEIMAEEHVESSPPASSPLKIPIRQFTPNLSPPAALLQAEYRQVPFHHRNSDIEALQAWCENTAPFKLQLLTGKGGMGKTRLAIELCLLQERRGWEAGFTSSSAEEPWEPSNRPSLIVIDYAETQREYLQAVLKAALKHPQRRVRILLVARAALDWWEELKSTRGIIGEALQGPATTHQRITPVALDENARKDSFQVALKAFAKTLSKTNDMPDKLQDIDLSPNPYERVLLIHMAALSTLEGSQENSDQAVLDAMLARELRHWRERLAAKQLPNYLAAGIAQAMAVVTMNNGVQTAPQAQVLLSSVPLLQDLPRALRQDVLETLHGLYPGEGWIEPLLPDLLGEHLIQRELEKAPEALLALTMGHQV